mgnify:CR=1 FL=1
MGELNHLLKSFISDFTFLSKDVLHVYGGVFFIIFWLLIFKGKYRYLSLAVLAALAIGNEVLDTLYYSQKELQVNWPESLSDIFNTIFLPILMLFFLRFKNRIIKN